MCGIIGYTGKKKALPILINGLKRLEYRGYDSAGVALITAGQVLIFKKKGYIDKLEASISADYGSKIGIAHTRWATHGEPSDINAHPFYDCAHQFAVVHNGIIENYSALKNELQKDGHNFVSDTDTEVIAHLLEENYKGDLEDAVRKTLLKLEGAYAIVILNKFRPNELICAKKGSPLIIGKGQGSYWIASDPVAIVEHTRKVIYLKDEEIAFISRQKCRITNLKSEKIIPRIDKIQVQSDKIDKNNFDTFMLKEIYEQPKSIDMAMRGRMNIKDGTIKLGGLLKHYNHLAKCNRMVLLGCGTSYHACLYGKYIIEALSKINVEAVYASEFRYSQQVFNPNDIVIAVSQSGETADTLGCLKDIKAKGITTFGICNVVGSSIAKEVDAGVYNRAGVEIGVASTKAFTSQAIVFILLAILIAQLKNRLTLTESKQILIELSKLPKKIKTHLEEAYKIAGIAHKCYKFTDALYLGRGFNYPIALEGSLKLKEISYIHSEGLPAGEMKHGTIALIDKNMLSIFVAPHDKLFPKIISNLEEVKARHGTTLIVSDKVIKQESDFSIKIPTSLEYFMPILAVIPLQLFAYYMALDRGCNIDKPRHLAKSVTVE